MTERVDFYVLPSTGSKHRWTFACRLAEKAYLRELEVVLVSETPEDAAALDELLWTFNERSFVPHDVCRTGEPCGAPVKLTSDLSAVDTADLLVNLSGRLPVGWERFARIAEIIDSDAELRRRGRDRFKAYRDLRVTVETHRLGDGAEA
jgi:DNA polymerase-3 subunit chi